MLEFTFKKIVEIFFSMHMVFDILDMKFLVKFATNRLDPFLVIK